MINLGRCLKDIWKIQHILLENFLSKIRIDVYFLRGKIDLL